MALNGEDILSTLSDLKRPASVGELLALLSSKNKGSQTTLTEAANLLIQAAVRFGCIVDERNKQREEQINENETNKETNKDTSGDTNKVTSKETLKRVISHTGLSSSDDENKPQDKKRKTEQIKDANDTEDCYGPSYRRRRSRSRRRPQSRKSLRRKQSGMRRGSSRR